MSASARVNITTQHPDAYQAMLTLSAAAEQAAVAADLDPLLVELIKLRTSQINGCAFCLRMHTRDAIAKGETADRLAVLPGWRESDYFSDVERAALAFAESITRVAQTQVGDGDYGAAAQQLTDDQLSAVAWLTTVMNAFNRLAITSHFPVTP